MPSREVGDHWCDHRPQPLTLVRLEGQVAGKDSRPWALHVPPVEGGAGWGKGFSEPAAAVAARSWSIEARVLYTVLWQLTDRCPEGLRQVPIREIPVGAKDRGESD